jgi:signal transduction histidine kinase
VSGRLDDRLDGRLDRSGWVRLDVKSWPAVVAGETLIIALAAADLAASTPAHVAPIVVSALAVAALALRRRWPLATMLLGIPNIIWGYALVAQLVATFTLAHRVRDRRLVISIVGVIAVAQVTGMFLLPGDSAPTEYLAQNVVFGLLIVGGPASLGLLLRAYEQLAGQLDELRARREREHELVAHTVLAQERTRLAREMHDVVSHQVSLIAVQAGALRMTSADARTRETAGTLRTLAAKTLTELREMVAVLRDKDRPESEVTPQPRLTDLPRLVADSGTGAELRAGPVLAREWPAPTERAAYRTVQEALTNVRKHATGALVTVELTADGGAIRVGVRNGCPPDAARRTDQLPGGGHGLIGLRERAELLGGTLVHRHMPDGGYEVVAVLPGRTAGRSAVSSRTSA